MHASLCFETFSFFGFYQHTCSQRSNASRNSCTPKHTFNTVTTTTHLTSRFWPLCCDEGELAKIVLKLPASAHWGNILNDDGCSSKSYPYELEMILLRRQSCAERLKETFAFLRLRINPRDLTRHLFRRNEMYVDSRP